MKGFSFLNFPSQCRPGVTSSPSGPRPARVVYPPPWRNGAHRL